MAASKRVVIPMLDGGRGWLAVLAGAISNFISMGLYRSGGIIYVESVTTFSASRSVAAWVPMVTLMVVFLTAPIGTYLATRFTFQRVILCGGSLASVGMLICFKAEHFETLLFGWSIIFGLGSSIAFFPCLALVGQCFKKKRPLANGIILAGGAIGCTFFPPFLEFLIEIYRLNGTCLILAGFVTHYIFCSFLLYSVLNRTQDKKTTLLQKEIELEYNKENLEQKPQPQLDDENQINIRKPKCQIDCSLLKNVTYIVNCFSNAIQVALFMAMVTILPDYGIDEIGTTKIEGTYFVSASAIADLCARLLCGVCLVNLKMKRRTLYFVILVVNTLDFIVLAFVPIYSVVFGASILGGALFASGMILYFEILASCQTPDRYPLAFGISEMMKAPFLLATASSVGYLKDATGSYSTTFVIFSVVELIAALLWVIDSYWKKVNSNKEIRK